MLAWIAAVALLAAAEQSPLEFGGEKAVVLLFVRADCPVSNRYAPEVNRLYRKFESRGIRFALVYVDPRTSAEEIEKHRRDFSYPFAGTVDQEHALVRLAGAKTTPEAAVFIKGGPAGSPRLVYRGRIDDRQVALGLSRKEATRRDLEEVLDQVVADKTVTQRFTRAVGCSIQDLR